jgi:hypothetical protein
MLSEADRGNNFNPPAAATPTIAPPATSPPSTTRSGRQFHFPARFNIWATISVGEVMWEPPTLSQALVNLKVADVIC